MNSNLLKSLNLKRGEDFDICKEFFADITDKQFEYKNLTKNLSLMIRYI